MLASHLCLLALVPSVLGAATAQPMAPDRIALFSVVNTSASTNVRTRLGTVRKHPANPLFQIGGASTPWLKDGIYSNIIYNQSATSARYRCYYSAALLCPPNKTDCTHGYETGSDGFNYAESADGINWRFPSLGLQAWPPGSNNTANNILFFDEAGTAAFEDDGQIVVAGQLTRNDSSMHAGGSGWYARSTDGSDGLNFAPPKRMAVRSTPGAGARWDTQVNLIRDPKTGLYVGSLRAPRNPKCGIWWPSCVGRHGCSGNASLPDGCGYAPSIVPSTDPVSVRAVAVIRGTSLDSFNETYTASTASAAGLPSPTRQLYSQVIFPYANVFLGIVSVAEVSKQTIVGSGFNRGAHVCSPMEQDEVCSPGAHVNRVRCALQWSPDLLHWHMIEPGQEFLPLSLSTSNNHTGFDTHLCYASTKPVFVGDGTARIYYGGSNGPHDGYNKSSFIGVATIDEQRFSGITALVEPMASKLQTLPLRCVGKHLHLTADVGTSIRVGVAGVTGMLLVDAVPLQSCNVTDHELAWSGGGDFTSLIGQDVVLILELVDAIVYQVSWHD